MSFLHWPIDMELLVSFRHSYNFGFHWLIHTQNDPWVRTVVRSSYIISAVRFIILVRHDLYTEMAPSGSQHMGSPVKKSFAIFWILCLYDQLTEQETEKMPYQYDCSFFSVSKMNCCSARLRNNHSCQGHPGYFCESLSSSMGLPETSRVTWHPW